MGMAEAVIATLDALDIHDFHLLGHSMGGMVAIQMALLAPARIDRLIAYATHTSGHLPDRFETFAQSKQRLADNFALARQQIAATWFITGEHHPSFNLVSDCAKHVTLDTARKALDAMAGFDVTDQLTRLTAKTLIISAEFDKTYTANSIAALKEQLPHAQFKCISDASHNAHLEQPRQFNDLVKAFIE